MLPNWMVRGQLVEIRIQCNVFDEILRQLRAKQVPADQLEPCENWLSEVRGVIDESFISHYDYDRAWSGLREIRHKLCSLVAADGLQRIAIEVEGELDYVSEASHRKSLRKEAAALLDQIMSLQQSDKLPDSVLTKCRTELSKLSMIAANARLEHWHKVNLLRSRVQITATTVALLALLLLVLMLCCPEFFAIDEQSRLVTFGVILFGGLGGFISALRQYEPLAGTSSGFYLERMLLGLRPLVGSVAGLVLYLGQISKIINLIPNPDAAGYFFVAFCAGFSEQFFLGHLKKEAQGEKRKQEQKGG